MRLRLDRIASPLGDIFLVIDEEDVLRALDFHDYEARMRRLLRRHYGVVELEAGSVPATITDPLGAYFDGDSESVGSMMVATAGSAFQKEVWAALRTIPAGATISYGALAATIGKPGAARAVGLANGANPIAIVVPCHRVIGANAVLTGYSGGLERKRWLLDHEGTAQASPRLC